MNRHSTHCDQCGWLLSMGDKWPKWCRGHESLVWPNPTPIAVALIPVVRLEDPYRLGILIGRRNHEPAKGLFGLPGGFQNDTFEGETLLEAAAREVREEMGLDLRLGGLNYHYEYANPLQCQTLVFFNYGPILTLGKDVDIGPCSASEECDFIDVAWSPCELAFHSHTQALKIWFDRHRNAYVGQSSTER